MRNRFLPAIALLLSGAFTAESQTDTTRRAATDTTRRAADSATRRPPAALPTLATGPAIRKISTASALSTEQLGSITSVRQLRDGRVLLNDGQRRRLLLLDTTLAVKEVVLDSLSETVNFYGTRSGALLPYRGDTTLFIDPASFAMILIDPMGRMGRVRSVPRAQEAGQLASNYTGYPGTDNKGRLIYRQYAEAGPPKVAPPPGEPWLPTDPDSAFVVGISVETRKVDTLGVIRIPKTENSVRISPTGGWNFNSVTNPLPTTDEWAVLSDGTVAFVRFRDYRVEYLQPDGTLKSSAKLPHDWQRLMEEDKQRIVDSVRAIQTRQAMSGYVTSLIRWVNQFGNQYPKTLEVPKDFNIPQGYQRSWKLPPGLSYPAKYVYGCAPGEEPVMIQDTTAKPGVALPTAPAANAPAPGSREAAIAAVMGNTPGGPGGQSGTPSCIPGPVVVPGGNSPPEPQLRTQGVMAPADLPDYRPPFNQNGVRSDSDGNLWVRINTPKPIPGGPIYDVINRDGVLFDRIQLPTGYSLVGFGEGKVVYLSMRDVKGVHLARVRLK